VRGDKMVMRWGVGQRHHMARVDGVRVRRRGARAAHECGVGGMGRGERLDHTAEAGESKMNMSN
jgi:hypothetical protein